MSHCFIVDMHTCISIYTFISWVQYLSTITCAIPRLTAISLITSSIPRSYIYLSSVNHFSFYFFFFLSSFFNWVIVNHAQLNRPDRRRCHQINKRKGFNYPSYCGFTLTSRRYNIGFEAALTVQLFGFLLLDLFSFIDGTRSPKLLGLRSIPTCAGKGPVEAVSLSEYAP